MAWAYAGGLHAESILRVRLSWGGARPGEDVVSREELYELVWSVPMIKVAEKFKVGWSAATAIRMAKCYGHIESHALQQAADVLRVANPSSSLLLDRFCSFTQDLQIA